MSRNPPYAWGAVAVAGLCASAAFCPFALTNAFLVAVLAGILQQSLP